MAVYGEKDEMKSEATNFLKLFRTSLKVIIPEAGHACYLDKPDGFNSRAIPFIENVLLGNKREL